MDDGKKPTNEPTNQTNKNNKQKCPQTPWINNKKPTPLCQKKQNQKQTNNSFKANKFYLTVIFWMEAKNHRSNDSFQKK